MRRPKAYLTYADEPEIRDLFLKQINTGIIITIGDKTFKAPRAFPKGLLIDLVERHGAVITKSDEVRYLGRKKVFDIPEAKSKIIRLAGERYIQIRILADSTEELFGKISKLKTILDEYGIREKMCAWDRLGKITVDYERPVKTVKPIFDQEQLFAQKSLELEAYREAL